ncbi:G-protein coupled receptor moody isoform X3 [Athalia rosae]|nr:G-protein coupled receptor moody isoform X3 [Athalia rosae]XP_048515363.1 G-protein coupled receptor moody isoform X3 [Athalia rosae]
MLEYWMANNASWANTTEEIEEVLEDPSTATLFNGYPPSLLYFAAGCCVLFMLIGIPGNLITVAALFRTKKLRNATAVFIMNLSVSDLMFCCFNLPLATSTFWHSSWLHGKLLCRLFPLLRYSLVAVSIFTVLAITINRYVMIGHPRLYPKIYTPKYLALMVVAIWTFGFGALVATWFGVWGRFGLDPVIGSCSILPDVHGRSPKEFLFIIAFLTPCIAIIVCYARIFYIVRKTALRSRRNKVNRDIVNKGNLEVRFTKGNHFEDSAIGSSCIATLTTTENGNSPTRRDNKSNNFVDKINAPRLTSSCSNSCQNIRLENPYRRSSVNSADRVRLHRENVENGKRSSTKGERRSSSDVYNLATVSSNDINENDHRKKLDSEKSNSGANERFKDDEIPFMDCNNVQTKNEELVRPWIVNDKRDEEGGEESGDNSAIKFAEMNSRPQIRFEEVYVEGTNEDGRIFDTETVGGGLRGGVARRDQRGRFEENSLQVPRRFEGVENSAESLLASQISRYDEISEDFVSSRSDSPTDKRSGKKNKIFRRESRFRSVRTRQFETGKLTAKDKKLLKMILVILASFLICYLPITLTKTFKDTMDWRGLNIAGYILIYLTTCINPVVYVVMSSEYRSAYKNVLLCRSDSVNSGRINNNVNNPTTNRERKKNNTLVV